VIPIICYSPYYAICHFKPPLPRFGRQLEFSVTNHPLPFTVALLALTSAHEANGYTGAESVDLLIRSGAVSAAAQRVKVAKQC
jgi:hypothetical protein